MIIKKIPYKASGTRKYNVMYNGKEYTCYLNPYNGNSVVTGDGQSTAYRETLHLEQKLYWPVMSMRRDRTMTKEQIEGNG